MSFSIMFSDMDCSVMNFVDILWILHNGGKITSNAFVS